MKKEGEISGFHFIFTAMPELDGRLLSLPFGPDISGQLHIGTCTPKHDEPFPLFDWNERLEMDRGNGLHAELAVEATSENTVEREAPEKKCKKRREKKAVKTGEPKAELDEDPMEDTSGDASTDSLEKHAESSALPSILKHQRGLLAKLSTGIGHSIEDSLSMLHSSHLTLDMVDERLAREEEQINAFLDNIEDRIRAENRLHDGDSRVLLHTLKQACEPEREVSRLESSVNDLCKNIPTTDKTAELIKQNRQLAKEIIEKLNLLDSTSDNLAKDPADSPTMITYGKIAEAIAAMYHLDDSLRTIRRFLPSEVQGGLVDDTLRTTELLSTAFADLIPPISMHSAMFPSSAAVSAHSLVPQSPSFSFTGPPSIASVSSTETAVLNNNNAVHTIRLDNWSSASNGSISNADTSFATDVLSQTSYETELSSYDQQQYSSKTAASSEAQDVLSFTSHHCDSEGLVTAPAGPFTEKSQSDIDTTDTHSEHSVMIFPSAELISNDATKTAVSSSKTDVTQMELMEIASALATALEADVSPSISTCLSGSFSDCDLTQFSTMSSESTGIVAE